MNQDQATEQDQVHTCNDAVLQLLREKLVDIEKVADHATEDISHVCVEKELLTSIRDAVRGHIGALDGALKDMAS